MPSEAIEPPIDSPKGYAEQWLPECPVCGMRQVVSRCRNCGWRPPPFPCDIRGCAGVATIRLRHTDEDDRESHVYLCDLHGNANWHREELAGAD